MANEQPVPLQTDTINQLPGAGVRTIVQAIPVGPQAAPTPMQQQVVTLADEDGILAENNPTIAMLTDIRDQLKILIQLYANATGQAYFEQSGSKDS